MSSYPCRILSSESELSGARKLLKKVYVDEMSFVPPMINPINQRIVDDSLIDDYDTQCIWFGCITGDEVVACCRIRPIKPTELECFLSEKSEIYCKLPSKYVELGRTACDKRFRRKGLHLIMYAFVLDYCWRRFNGIPFVTTSNIDVIVKLLSGYGECLGSMKYYHDDTELVNVYVIYDVLKAADRCTMLHRRISKL